MRPVKKCFLLLFLLSSFIVNSQADSVGVDESIFMSVDVEASYPGGNQAWRKFLEQNLDAAIPIKNSAPVSHYTVWVQFMVSIDGSISDIKALTRLGYGMEAEVIRVFKKSGKWTPAMQGDKPVKAYRKQPVTFVVIDDAFDIKTRTPYVLYTGADNELSIDVARVKKEDIQLIAPQARILRGGSGNFIVRITRPGRIVIEIFNLKKDKRIGAASFEVLTPGDPSLKLPPPANK